MESEPNTIQVPEWQSPLPLFTAQPGTFFYFKPFRCVSFGSPLPRIFPFKTFAHNEQVYSLWPSAANFISLLERSSVFNAVFPMQLRNYATVGFAYPDHERGGCGFPWESPSLLVLGVSHDPFGEMSQSAWLHCQQKADSVLVNDEAAACPVVEGDKKPLYSRMQSYERHLGDLQHLLPLPSIAVLREVFGLSEDFHIPGNLLPPAQS